MREEDISTTTLGGKIYDDRLADRGDRLCVGRFPGDRFRDSDQGIWFRQHLDPGRRGRGLHRHDPARHWDRRARIEDHCAAATPRRTACTDGTAIDPT